VPVRTVDGESLSEIAIHNFEKSRKIEIRVLHMEVKLLPETKTESVIYTTLQLQLPLTNLSVKY